ncbi:MAG: hypothetical protein HQL56_02180 [Magnetococcales bacterium]|nr:hypothetical protein [Magnetococcales bacterium]
MTRQAIDMEKLVKVLNMISSDQEGEVVTAARMASRMLRRAQIRFEDLLQPAEEGEESVWEEMETRKLACLREEFDNRCNSLHANYTQEIFRLKAQLDMAQEQNRRMAEELRAEIRLEYEQELQTLTQRVNWWKWKAQQSNPSVRGDEAKNGGGLFSGGVDWFRKRPAMAGS